MRCTVIAGWKQFSTEEMKTVRAELVKTWEPKFCPCPCRGQLRRMLVSRLDLPVSWTGVIQIARQVRVAAFQSDGNRKRGCTPPRPKTAFEASGVCKPWVGVVERHATVPAKLTRDPGRLGRHCPHPCCNREPAGEPHESPSQVDKSKS